MERHLTRRRLLQASTVAAGMIAAPSFVTRGTRDSVSADDVPLRQLADNLGISIGAHVMPYDTANKPLIAREFNLAQPGMFNWGTIYKKGLDQPDFTLADQWIRFSRDGGQKIRIQPVVYHLGIPDGMNALSPDQLNAFLQDHITRIVTRYADADEIVVVNEAVLPTKTLQYTDNLFYRRLGADYIANAFRVARAANPNAKLVYNDFGAETPSPKADNVFAIAQALQAQGLLDVVGMQMHVTGGNGNPDPLNFPSSDVLIGQIQRYQTLGIKVKITEMDVDTSAMQGGDSDRLAQQAEIYARVMRAALDSGNCDEVTVWGINDQQSWLIDRGGKAPLLFDNGSPKPAYFAIRDVLTQYQPGQ